MKQRYFEYPTFTSGEVLSKSLLDNLVGYDDEQSRLTRCKLIGSGIVEGLRFSYDEEDGVLTIKPGTAVTNVGNMICVDSDAKYYLYLNANATSLQDKYVFSKEEFLDLPRQKKAKLPSNVVLALRYDRKPVSSDVCSQGSCDMVHVRTIIEISPVLFSKNSVEKAFVFPKLLPSKAEILSFNNIAVCLNTNVLHKEIKNTCRSNAYSILKLMKEIETVIESKDNIFRLILGDYQKRRAQWHNALNRIAKIQTQASSSSNLVSIEIPQYYLDFLEDIKDALNEFLDCYNSFVYECRKLGHHYFVADDVVMLGDVVAMSTEEDPYRNYFELAIDGLEMRRRISLIERHMSRVSVMIEQFVGTNCQWGDVKCTLVPVEYHSRIADRPIPFYYNTEGTQLREVWDPCTFGVPSRQRSLDDFKPDDCLRMDSLTSGYQLTGYYNKTVGEIMSSLTSAIDMYSLPVSIKRIKMFKGTFHSSKSNVKAVKSLIGILQNVDTSSLDSMASSSPFGSLRAQRDFVATIKNMSNNALIDRCVTSADTNILCLKEAKKYILRYSVDQLFACLSDELFAAGTDLDKNASSKVKDSYRSAFEKFYKYLENAANYLDEATSAKIHYVGKGDTIYLCHYNGKVVFVFSAPSLE